MLRCRAACRVEGFDSHSGAKGASSSVWNQLHLYTSGTWASQGSWVWGRFSGFTGASETLTRECRAAATKDIGVEQAGHAQIPTRSRPL